MCKSSSFWKMQERSNAGCEKLFFEGDERFPNEILQMLAITISLGNGMETRCSNSFLPRLIMFDGAIFRRMLLEDAPVNADKVWCLFLICAAQ